LLASSKGEGKEKGEAKGDQKEKESISYLFLLFSFNLREDAREKI